MDEDQVMTRLCSGAALLVCLGLPLAACSSSGSAASAPPATQRPTATPSPAASGMPTVTEVFTVLPCPAHPKETVEIEGCAEHQIVRLDGQINRTAKALYRGQVDAATKASLAGAQQAWIAYRQAECVAEAAPYTGGTLYPIAFSNCEVRLDQARLRDLHTMKEELKP
jgi:uncharacterized protein YecT (DUF1311 family)